MVDSACGSTSEWRKATQRGVKRLRTNHLLTRKHGLSEEVPQLMRRSRRRVVVETRMLTRPILRCLDSNAGRSECKHGT